MEDKIMQMLQSLSYQLEKQDEALSLLEAEQNILASKAIKQVESSQVSVLDRVKDISSSSALASDILSSVKSSIPQSNKLCKSLPSVVSQSQLWSQSRLKSQSKSYSRSSLSCFKCKGSHTMRYCEEFRALQPQERMKFVNQRRICSCCLSSKCHPWQKCPTIRTCNLNGCDEKHHRMLHRRYSGSSVSDSRVASNSEAEQHLRGLPIPSLENAVPKVLIGIRHSKYLVPVQSFVGQQDDPVACRTHFGWTVFGVSNPSFGKSSTPDVHLSINKVVKSEVAAPEVRSSEVSIERNVAKYSSKFFITKLLLCVLKDHCHVVTHVLIKGRSNAKKCSAAGALMQLG
ncbi:CLUMA_CG008937, isoform A [Clunio marinus]|uniref:CLUMA_CG008937, isoform A n=1 Tax=Clunio marinus TaxID=568069 RepID=A0A1J1I7A8_9DIPT|nr:CLUMA_CG008937, isoform A [Clunio marinus]